MAGLARNFHIMIQIEPAISALLAHQIRRTFRDSLPGGFQIDKLRSVLIQCDHIIGHVQEYRGTRDYRRDSASDPRMAARFPDPGRRHRGVAIASGARQAVRASLSSIPPQRSATEDFGSVILFVPVRPMQPPG